LKFQRYQVFSNFKKRFNPAIRNLRKGDYILSMELIKPEKGISPKISNLKNGEGENWKGFLKKGNF